MTSIIENIKARGENISPLEGHDRLQYLVDLARDVPPLPNRHKTDENKIRGCVSNLWVTGKILQDGTMKYRHDAESYITKGTAKIILDIVNGEHKSEVSQLKVESFKALGIKELLTMQRQVGFASLIERVIKVAHDN